MATSEPLGISAAIHAEEVHPEWDWMWRRLLAPLPNDQQERRPLDCESGERRSEASHLQTSDRSIAPTAPAAPPSSDQATAAASTADPEHPVSQAQEGAA
jgi:hypothetical protein